MPDQERKKENCTPLATSTGRKHEKKYVSVLFYQRARARARVCVCVCVCKSLSVAGLCTFGQRLSIRKAGTSVSDKFRWFSVILCYSLSRPETAKRRRPFLSLMKLISEDAGIVRKSRQKKIGTFCLTRTEGKGGRS